VLIKTTIFGKIKSCFFNVFILNAVTTCH